MGPKELARALRRLTGYTVTRWEAESIVDAMDADGDGHVSYSEFANKLLEAGAKAADDVERMEKQQAALDKLGGSAGVVAVLGNAREATPGGASGPKGRLLADKTAVQWGLE